MDDNKTNIKNLPKVEQISGTDLVLVSVNGKGYRALASLLKGQKGDEIELRITDTHIQWCLTGGEWTNLISFAELRGPVEDSAKEATGAAQKATEAAQKANEAAQNANNAAGAVNDKLDKTGDGQDVTVTFSEAVSRVSINSREKLSVLFGKIKRWFADLKNVAFTGRAADLTQDADNRLVTDSEKAGWNDKYTRAEVDNKDAVGLQVAKEYVSRKVAEIVNGSPEALNTLQELAAALGNDPNFATSIMALLGGKADRNELNSKVNVDGSNVMSGALYINNSATDNGLKARFAKNAAGDAVVMSLNDAANVALCSLAANVNNAVYFNGKVSYNIWHQGNLLLAKANSTVKSELANKVPQYNHEGYLSAYVFKDGYPVDTEIPIKEICFRWSQDDGYHRWCSLARLKTALGSMPANRGNADTVGGLPLSYIMRRNSGAEIQANAILGTSQYGFGYETKGFPISGSFISFGGFGDDYTTQIIASYKGDRIYFRTYDGDLKKWNGWQRLARYSEALLNSGEQTLSRGRFNMLVSAREHVIMFKDAAGDIGYIGFGVYPTKDLQIYNYATGKYINIAADGKLYYDGKELATVDQLSGSGSGAIDSGWQAWTFPPGTNHTFIDPVPQYRYRNGILYLNGSFYRNASLGNKTVLINGSKLTAYGFDPSDIYNKVVYSGIDCLKSLIKITYSGGTEALEIWCEEAEHEFDFCNLAIPLF